MKYFSFLFLLLAMISCKSEPVIIETNAYLTNEQQEDFKYSIIRYADRLPKKATHQTKFDTVFSTEYKKQAEASEVLFYHIDSTTNTHYFALTKIAPSMILKKVAVVGKLKYDKNGAISDYEESFRTWKMEIPELKTKTEEMFIKFINGEDLSSYYTVNSKGNFYIEFPDEKTYYDKKARNWKTKE